MISVGTGSACFNSKYSFITVANSLWHMAPIPDTVSRCYWRFRPRDWTMRSEMKDVVDPESSSARALIDVPSGALTWTWQVMRRVFGTLDPVEALDDTWTGWEVVGGTWGGVVEVISAVALEGSLESSCISVWWDLSHFLHLFELGHCLAKWPGFRQLMHNSLFRMTDIFLSWVIALNWEQANCACLSPLQTMQVVLTPAVNVAVRGWKFLLWASFLWGLGLRSVGKHSDAWALRLMKSRNLSYPETVAESWSCSCHSNVVASNFSCRNEVMNGPSGSFPSAFKARMCCCAVSWRRRSSLPLLSLREGISTIFLTWAWWMSFGRL